MPIVSYYNQFGDPKQHDTEQCESCKNQKVHKELSLYQMLDLPKFIKKRNVEEKIKSMPYKSQSTYADREEKINKRIAVKDKIFVVLNASKAAAELVNAEAQSGKKIENALERYRELRNAINQENWDLIFSQEEENGEPVVQE